MSIFTQYTILRHVEKVGYTSATNASKATGLSVSTCSKYLKSLAAQGAISAQTRSYRHGIDAVTYKSKKVVTHE